MTYEQFSLVVKTLFEACPEQAERWFDELMAGAQKQFLEQLAARLPQMTADFTAMLSSAVAERERAAMVRAAMTSMAKPRGQS